MITEELRLYAKRLRKQRGKGSRTGRAQNIHMNPNPNSSSNPNGGLHADIPISDETQEILDRRKRWEDDGPYVKRSAKGNVQTTYEMPEVSPEFYNTSYLKEPSQLPEKLNIPKPQLAETKWYNPNPLPRLSNMWKLDNYDKAKISAISSVPNEEPPGGIRGKWQNKMGKMRDWVTSRYSIKYDLNTRTFSLIDNG